MGYLDNSSITVDAVLTKKGREILKDGGNLNISSFTLSDTGVDYTLWNVDHPSGSAKYGEAIENLPQLEASVHAEYNLRNRLISLNQNSIALPALVIDSGTDEDDGDLKTFKDGKEASGTITLRLVGYSSTVASTIGMVVQNPNVVSVSPPAKAVRLNTAGGNGLSGTSIARQFLSTEEIAQAMEYEITTVVQGTDRIATVNIRPIQQTSTGQETNIYFVDYETGAQRSIRILNNITKPVSTLLASGGTGA